MSNLSHIETIIEMHRYKRPAFSVTEGEFIKRFLQPLGVQVDVHGNYWVIVGKSKPDILWSCHTDTVHKMPGMQRLSFDGTMLKLHRKANSSCLGADCGAGVWLMTEMIKAGKPGFYIFHADEEMGGHGSAGFVQDQEKFLKGFKAAVAFDRRGRDSIITHMGARTCSDAFANSLAKQLSGYKIDTGGLFTDTKNYRKIIPECTNISVGYQGAHTSNEQLDVIHLIALRDMLLGLDTSKLVIERDPASKDEYLPYEYGGYYGGYGKNSIRGLIWHDADATAKVIEGLGLNFEMFEKLYREAQAKKKPWLEGLGSFADKGSATSTATTAKASTTANVNGHQDGKVTAFPGHAQAKGQLVQL